MMMSEQGKIYFYEDGKTLSTTIEYTDTLSDDMLQRLAEKSQISDEERRTLLKGYTFDKFGNFYPMVQLDNMEV